MTEQEFVYVDVDYLKELEETAKKVDYYKGIIDGINLAIDRKDEPQREPTFEEVEEYCKKRCLTIVTNEFLRWLLNGTDGKE